MKTQYSDHKIALTEDFWFKITGPLFPEDRHFESYAEAIAAIDKRVKQQEAQERVKLSIPLLDDNGNEVIVTGVHARNFNALGVGGARSLYPREPWIKDTIVKLGEAQRLVKFLQNELATVRIDPKSYGNRTHEQAIITLQKSVASKAEIAKAKGVEKVDA